MRNLYLKKVISLLSCTILSVLFVVILFFYGPKINSTIESERTVEYIKTFRDENDKLKIEQITAIAGQDFTAVNISDLNKLQKITKVNYVADQFVTPGHLSSNIQIVDLEKPFEFAQKGTLMFVILNLDPNSEKFDEQSENLSEYKIGDNWHFTLSLPKIFSASNIYQKTILVSRHGDIENYDFGIFNDNYNIKTEKFSSQTENTMIDLSFYTKRIALANSLSAAQIITIHYQSTGSAYSGIMNAPLIGTEDAVKGVTELSKNFLIIFAIIAIVVFAVFAVLSLLKHTKKFFSAILWIFGIALLLVSRFFLVQTTKNPLMWTAFWQCSSFIILIGALLSTCKNIGKIPTKYIFPVISLVGMMLAFISVFVPFNAASSLKIVCAIIKGISTMTLFGFIAYSISDKKDDNSFLKTICAVIIGIALLTSLFMPQVFPAQYNPIFWLCVLTIIMTFISVFLLFYQTEQENIYLTSNLSSEVERQVKDIKAIIGERDKLLQFVSHDMRKPLVSSIILMDTIIKHEKDNEQTKALQIIKQNASKVVENLSDIATYAKLNYIAEPSQVINLSELCHQLYQLHELDCNANGIILKHTIEPSMKAFVKKQGLENVISNLIINAIEHANCSTITLSVKSQKNIVLLSVADDGKGIPENLDIFAPYVSESNSQTAGIGLYICKNIIESMNGTLSFESNENGTIFFISLLKA